MTRLRAGIAALGAIILVILLIALWSGATHAARPIAKMPAEMRLPAALPGTPVSDMRTIAGLIVAIDGPTLKITGHIGGATSPEPFHIRVSASTTIERASVSGALVDRMPPKDVPHVSTKTTSLALSDLSVGMPVTIILAPVSPDLTAADILVVGARP